MSLICLQFHIIFKPARANNALLLSSLRCHVFGQELIEINGEVCLDSSRKIMIIIRKIIYWHPLRKTINHEGKGAEAIRIGLA